MEDGCLEQDQAAMFFVLFFGWGTWASFSVYLEHPSPVSFATVPHDLHGRYRKPFGRSLDIICF